MKGYLRQLVAGAARGQARLRPFVGSIFSGESRDESADVRPAERNAEGSAPGTRRSEPASAQPAAADPRSSPVETAWDSTPSRPVIPKSFAPLLPPEGAKDDSSRPRNQEMSLETPRLHASVVTTTMATDSGTISPERGVVSRPSVPPPPVADRVEQRAAEAGSRLLPVREGMHTTAGVVARRKSEERAAFERAPQKTAGDDIQIHIGRIEVTAVPPPVQRPASASASRSTSLKDYLKSRGGRAR
jgi:hypothetical protein